MTLSHLSIHIKSLQKLPTEMFKISKNLSVPLMIELFYQKVNNYDLRNPYEFSIPNVNSVFHGQASKRYLGPIIWQLVTSELKHLTTVSAFKAGIGKGSQTTDHTGYVKHILEMLDLFKLPVWV